MRRNLLVIVPTSLLALLLTGCSGATGGSSSGADTKAGLDAAKLVSATRATKSTKGHRSRFTATGPTPTILPPVCDPEQHCAYPGSQTLQLTGDWTGTWIQASGAASLTDGSKFTSGGINVFVGSIKGCGTGTAVVRLFETGALSPPSGKGVWEVVPGFGTGRLASLRGSGTGTGGVENGVRESTQTGRITCSRR